jgi:nicotinate-nucleotide adenylyltransferase
MSRKAIGILGGVFDPIHNGHLAVARLALDSLGLEEVYFVPTGNPPHKGSVAAAPAHRLAMLRLALKGRAGFKVCEGETKRQGISYTIDTIHSFQKWVGDREICFIIGSDNLTEIRSWRRFDEIVASVTLCVAHRPGFSVRPPRELKKARIVQVASPEWGISSTMVREYLGRGYGCEYLVPDAVLAYARSHGLYGAGNRTSSK